MELVLPVLVLVAVLPGMQRVNSQFPSGQPAPLINETTPTSIALTWDSPIEPNGLISSYSVLRRAPSLSPSPLRRDVGVAFDGNIIKRFSPDDNSLGGITNAISFSFRTFSSRGTILYYINTAATDYVAIELRNGVPWFFFDAGSGPAVIQPDLGGANVTFNDGAWHSVTATQTGRTGSIMVDGTYSGTGQSSGSDQVISSRQVLHVGGIPEGVPRSSLQGFSNPSSTLEGQSYAGCLFGVNINNQPLDFDGSSTDLGDSQIQDIPGCPIELVQGWSFLGGGYLAFPESTLDSTSFSWSVDIRTTHMEGMVLFAYATDRSAVALELRASVLRLLLVGANSTEMLAIGNNLTCDGRWHTVLVNRSQDEIFASVDGNRGSLFLQTSNTTFSSRVFLGGVPMGSVAYDIAQGAGVNVYAPFSGCARNSRLIVGGVMVSELTPSSQSFVRFDGCPSATSSFPTACGVSWTSLPAGTSTRLTDMGLGPWTEYLYRVRAQNSVGFTVSPWIPAITEEAAPSGVGMVSIVTRTSSSLTISWTTPTMSNGLVTRYEVTLNPVRTVGLATPTGGSISVGLAVEEPEMVLLALANGLQPATAYNTVLTAFTSGGSGSGLVAQLTTAPDPYVVFASKDAIYQVNLDGTDLQVLDNESYYVAIDYDIRRNYLFWTDILVRRIMWANLDGSQPRVLVDSGLNHTDGLAWDWLNEKLYWTDTFRKIEVYDINSRYRTKLIDTGVDSIPRGIVLDPETRYMYWTDWGRPAKIERASMDGTARETLHSTALIWPNGITIDYQSQTIYWIDASLDKLESSHVTGLSRRVLSRELIRHPFSLTFYDGTLYWSDWGYDRVLFASLSNIERVIGLVPVLSNDPTGVRVVALDAQPINSPNPCSVDNGGCSHLCLLTASGNSNHSCNCPAILELDDDGLNCIEATFFELRLGGLTDCTSWRRNATSAKDMDIVEVLVDNVVSRCGCNFTEDRITERVFQCFQSIPQLVIYRAKLRGTLQESVSRLLRILEGWASSVNTIVVQFMPLSVESFYPAASCSPCPGDIITTAATPTSSPETSNHQISGATPNNQPNVNQSSVTTATIAVIILLHVCN